MSNVQSNASPAPSTQSASQSGRAGSPSVAGSASATQMRSYANATKKSFSSPPGAQGSNTSSSAQSASHNGQQESSNKQALANGPTIVNSSNSVNGDSAKKPSVTISAAGASGHLPNGGPITPNARPNINFGSLNESGLSAATNSASQPQVSATPASNANPRITSPTTSPSPIPQPATISGGKVPANLQTQVNGLNFGSISGSESSQARSSSGPIAAQQLRRDGSQQSHGEMGNSGMGRGGYVPGGGRGGRGYQQGFNQPPFSPGQSFRSMQNQQRPGSNYAQHFQGQIPQLGSPHAASRTPNFQHSQPGTPQMQMGGLMASQHSPYAPPFNAYSQHLGPQPGQFGMQPQFDPNYGYYQAPYQMHPQYLQQQGQNQSPRQYKSAPGGAPQQFVPSPYNTSQSQNMSRSSSQISERPASVQPPQPQQPSSMPLTLAPPMSAQAPPANPASSSNFSIPIRAKKSAAIVIKNTDGEIITFDKKAAPATVPVAKSPSPAPTSATTSTPPPRSGSISAKTAAEIKAEFQEQVKKGQEEEKRLKEEEDSKLAKAKEDEESAAKAKQEAEAQAAKAKEDEEAAKVAKAKEEAEAQAAATAAKEKADADAKAAEEAQAKEAAEAKEAKEAADAKAAKEQQDEQDKLKAEANQKAETDKAESDAAEKKRLEDEEMERMIAEMEAQEKEDEEREKKYNAEKAAKAAEKAKADALKNDEEMRRLEREAEALEEAREKKQNPEDEESEEAKAEKEKLFASLKKPTLGPGAEETEATTASTEEPEATPAPRSTSAKPKPLPLKLDVSKSVEPAQPTPGMQSLKSARMLQLQSETVSYPEGIQSPNPALNQSGKRNGRLYDKDFLLQFQEAFKEKPSVDWDQKLKDTVHDSNDSAGPKSARGGLSARTPSSRGPPQGPFVPMGSIGAGGRTLPANTTSEARFQASLRGGPTMSNPLAGYAPRGGAFPMGGAAMSRQGSLQASHAHSPRAGTSQRGKPSGRGRDDRAPSRKEQEHQNKSMPLTAGTDLKPLELSRTGWKPMSIVAPQAAAAAPDGHMAPDMVQRKVKSNLNKMTPERFDKIADQVLTIAAQSKDETDGRTLRQVIALTFEKACDEAHWASMYAKFCKRMLEEMSPEIKDENVRDKTGSPVVGGPLFRKYLLNRCQEEFERGWDINLAEQTNTEDTAGGEAVMLSEEYYIAAAAKRKGLGLVQFIGELYKLGMLSIKIMHGCVIKLLDFEGLPQESTVESLVKLLRAVGGTMESAAEGPPIVKTYFDRIDRIMALPNLPSRLHFMLLDLLDLRKGGWHSKDDQKGPKTIQEIRDDAAIAQQQAELERARTSQRGGHGGGGGGRPPAGRGDARFGGGPMAPPDYPRNQVGSDDLKRLGLKASSRQASSAGGPSTRLGPTSMFASRTASGRTGLGPPGGMMNRDDAGSRTNSQRGGGKKDEEEEPKTNANAFSALMGLDPSGEDTQPSPIASPVAAKAQPVAPAAEEAGDVDGKLAEEAAKEAEEEVKEGGGGDDA